MTRRHQDDEQDRSQWKPQTQEPPKDFWCAQCNGSGFVPVCFVNGHNVAIVTSATCDCQRGRYEAEYLERDSRLKNTNETIRGRRFRLEDARRRDLVPQERTSHIRYWLHAKLAEARHDMVRMESQDDRLIRYFEAMLNGDNPDEWIAKNGAPNGAATTVDRKEPKEEVTT